MYTRTTLRQISVGIPLKQRPAVLQEQNFLKTISNLQESCCTRFEHLRRRYFFHAGEEK